MSEIINNEQNEKPLLSIAEGIGNIYQSFTDALSNLSGRKNNQLAGSFTKWLLGSHVKTEKDTICEKFITDMQSQLELFDQAMEGCDDSSVTEACTSVVKICSQTVPGNSNNTSDLMKRAMIRMAIKYLPKASREELLEARERVSKAYPKWNRLPVEKDFIKAVDKIIG